MGGRNSTKLPESFYSNGHSIGELEVVQTLVLIKVVSLHVVVV